MSVGAVNKQTGDRIPTAGMPAVDAVLSGTSTNPVQNKVVKEALDAKQDTLTFDNVPTENSTNPVKSGGVYSALATKANTDMVAADFNAGTSYTAGNYCIYGGKFYKFNKNHSGAWAAADVDEIKIAGELSSLNSNIATLQTVKLNVIKKETGSGTTFTIRFPTHGSRVYALLFGRFGYQQSKLSIAVISHATENEAYIMCLGDETATVSCTGHVVTVTTPGAYATVDVVSPEDIS